MSIKTIVEPDVATSEPSGSSDGDRAAFAARLEGGAVLLCSGELDPATNPALRRSLRRLLRFGPDRVVIDLSRVSFFDAGAIGELVRARNTSRAAGRDLVVRAPSPFGRRVLSIVGLTDLIAEEPTRDTAPSNAPAAVGAHGAELVAAWEAACATARYGAASLGFEPTAAAAALTTLIDDPSSVDQSVADLHSAAVRREEMSPATGVMQLWALRDVLYAWIEANWGPTLGSRGDEGRRVDLEAALAGMVSSALTELEQATLLDPLTGLLNRRALDRDLLQSLAAARRHGQCLSVVMIDVEGLKATNDQFGHAAGDDILRGVATNLASALRAGDDAYRIGGDEFVLLLPELCPDDVDGVMERANVGAQGAFTWGCAWVQGDDDATPDVERAAHLLQQADQRMLDHRALIRRSRDGADVSLASTRAPVEPAVELAGRFTAANRSSVVIDEARGLIAEHFDIGIDEASMMLRAFSTAQHQPMLTAAVALMNRSIAVARLAPHRPGRPAAAEGDPEEGARGRATPRGG